MTTPFTDKPTLVGDLVTLRPVTADDAEPIDRLIREDDEIVRLTGSAHSSTEPYDGMPLEKLREIYGSWAVAQDRLVLAVVDASGDLVGEVVLNEWDEGNRSCSFRTLIGRAGRGRGLGTEATRLVVAHGLGPMGLHRIGLEVYAFNPRARRVYEKVGFVHEGTGREALLFDDEWVDVHFMAILGDQHSQRSPADQEHDPTDGRRLRSRRATTETASHPGRRRLVLCKRWSLRAGVTPDDVAALVRGHVQPAYRRLSTEVRLGLEVASDGRSIVAVQRWTSVDAHAAATSGDGYASWWAGYEPSLRRWDRLVELVSEWSSVEVDLGT